MDHLAWLSKHPAALRPPAAPGRTIGALRGGWRLVLIVVAGSVLLASGCTASRPVDPAEDAGPTAPDLAAASRVGTAQAADALPLDHPMDEQALVDLVLARNPTLLAMRAAWRQAQARAPQDAAVPEPTLSYGLAPASLGESLPGQSITLTEPLPWPQRLSQRSDIADFGADAAEADLTTSRLQLVADAKQAFAEYWLADGQLRVNAQLRTVVAQLDAVQTTAYGAGQGTRITALVGEAALNELDHHAIMFVHQRALAIARLNYLLHQPSDHPLPPPPLALPEPIPISDARQLTTLALAQRSDLCAAQARVRQADARSGLVGLQDLPEVSLSVGYDTMWNDPNMRLMVGVEVALPLNRDARGAARDEAQAGSDQARAQLQALTDRVQYEVQERFEHVLESLHILHLLHDRSIPTAQAILAAAQSGAASGNDATVAVLDARRQLIAVQWEYQQAVADCHEHLADLERVIGGPLPPPAPAQETP